MPSVTPRKAKPRPTINEVAQRAGVAKTTVSHAISGKRPVAPATRERIFKAMGELQYSPSPIARRLAGSPSHTVALVLPLASSTFADVEVRYIASIGAVVNQHGYTFLTLTAPQVNVDDLRQNPHTYWGVLKNFIWYRAGMIERAHPMITGFFRMKDRTSRRPGFPVEGRPRFAWRRLRETLLVLREYARVYVEMQDLWLQTRIRRDDYAPLGDLRQLASRSMQEVKLNWARAHAVMAAQLASLRKEPEAGASGPFFARLDAVCHAISARKGEFEASLADLRRARQRFELALRDDPQSAIALTGLSARAVTAVPLRSRRPG